MSRQLTKEHKILIGAAVVLAALVAVFAIVYAVTRPETQSGEKTITFEVIDAEGASESFTIETDAEYLRQALEQEGLIEGDESEYGLFVTVVNGIAADDSQSQWWAFSKDGVMLETGVDSTPVADGDQFEATLSTY